MPVPCSAVCKLQYAVLEWMRSTAEQAVTMTSSTAIQMREVFCHSFISAFLQSVAEFRYSPYRIPKIQLFA